MHLVNSQPHSELVAYIRTADVSLVLLESGCLSHEFALPNKTLESLLSNVPIVVSPLKELSMFAKHHDDAYIFQGSKPDDLVSKIQEVIERKRRNHSENRIPIIADEYSADTQAKKLEAIYDALTNGSELPTYSTLPHYSP